MRGARMLVTAAVCVFFTAVSWVHAGNSGIWKSTDQSMNFYIQTYSAGSCMVIATPDGEAFYVFLDAECSDEVVAPEYFGRSAGLDLKFLSADTATAALVIAGGRTEYTLNKVFEGDCRDGDDTEPITNSLGMTFVYVSPGTFTMGSPSDEPGRDVDETPHQVTLTQGFHLQTTEVTQGQWKAVMGSNPSAYDTCGDDCPVEMVSWEDVQAFIAQLNSFGEGTYRLPTEAEWEYAARAGTTTAFADGGISVPGCGLDPNLNDMGWYCYNAEGKTHPVAQKAPNARGLYDMHGNVWEWCQDWFGSYPSDSVTDPAGPASGSYRVQRGGGWYHDARYCRSASRGYHSPDAANDCVLGVRLVRIAP